MKALRAAPKQRNGSPLERIDKVFQTDVVCSLDSLDAKEAVGWIFMQGEASKPITVSARIDGKPLVSVCADIPREDVLLAGFGRSNVGFRIPFPTCYHDEREHDVEFFINGDTPLTLWNSSEGFASSKWKLPCPRPQSESSIVYVDSLSENGLVGWGYDSRAREIPTQLVLHIDDKRVTEIRCDEEREDVRKSGHPNGRVGFRYAIPKRYFDDQPHRLSLKGLDGSPVRLSDAAGPHSEGLRFRFSSATVLGCVDGLREGAIRGWAISRDCRDNRVFVGLQILVTLQGQPVAQLRANQLRPDVANALGCDPNCGFAFTPPPDLLAGKTVQLGFKVIPGGTELRGSPYTAAFPELETYRRIRELSEEIEGIFTKLWHLRAAAKGLLPGAEFGLGTYPLWAQKYFASLESAVFPASEASAGDPLVSIVCPVYRPRMQDFVAAVESVLTQSYDRWELILVDDGSRSPELAACIRQFAQRDPRILSICRKNNEGISVATNAALNIARGEYVAFFDHDDLMVARAIEVMVRSAQRSGAKLLYCDEDKIDDGGLLSEVHLKPDWNYRLLLAQNYVCHLLFVERAQLEKVGPLRQEYDGAQDHDLVLRLSEITPLDQIHHVPEVLYHWRKTPQSTALSCDGKPHAVAAGIRAVSAHLARIGKSAQVSSPRNDTCYQVQWVLSAEPRVTIIIPYRDHIGMTRNCVSALRSVTTYRNLEVILVDNWSTSEEAFEFEREMRASEGVRLFRVEEPFNFSRLNNLAVARAGGEFLLFMNNDVMVSDPLWLTAMVGEALSDPRVAIVGNKLLHPNGLVQHGGVVLGVGGVADHAHRGLTADAQGYMSRAVCAQDLSAVTAACMLCRRDIFLEVGGFDEVELQVAFNDVDLCLKVGRAGYRIIWTPQSMAEHHESLSRGSDFRPEQQARFFHENKVMEQRWKDQIARDPYYNKNFSRRSGIFSDLGSFF